MRRPRLTPFSFVSLLASASLLGALAVSFACGPSGFTSSTVINSVRILATRVDGDKSYAHPGDVVTLETLTVDGRPIKSPPAVTYWIPFICENPVDDAYYGCFASLIGEDAGATTSGQLPPIADAGPDDASADAGLYGGAEDAGEDAGDDAGLSPVIPPSALGALFQPNVNITPYLSTGPFTFQVPLDAIATHAPVSGADPYGIVIVFNIACAGQVRTLPVDPAAGPQQVPISCFDAQGNQLGPDQYVIGFTRVFVSASLVNPNPVISGFLFNGIETFTGDAGNALPAPITVTVPADGGGANGVAIDTYVPASSWTPHKEIWVDYYATNEGLSDEARLLYDQTSGAVANTVNTAANAVTYTPPDDAGAQSLWAVVHDSNDGVTWLKVNVAAN